MPITTPSETIGRILGHPSIPLTGNIGLLHRLRLNLERTGLRGSSDLFAALSKALATPTGQRAMMAAIASGSALGAGSLAWALAKNSPQGPSRLANAIENALFETNADQSADATIESAPIARAADEGEAPWGQYGA